MVKKVFVGVLAFVGIGALGIFGLEKTEEKAGQELSEKLINNGTILYTDYIKSARHNLEKFQCNGKPLYMFIEEQRRAMGLPEVALYLIFRESGKSANPYAVGCDECRGSSVCFKNGGPSSLRNKSLGVEWLNAFYELGLYRYCLCRAFHDPVVARDRICSVGFGLMQITTTSLRGYTGRYIEPQALRLSKIHATAGGRVNPELVAQEPARSPFNPCTNTYIGLLILQEKAKSCGNKPVCTVCRYSGRAMGMASLAKYIEEDLKAAGIKPEVSWIAKLGLTYSGIKERLLYYAQKFRLIPDMAECPTNI